MTTSLRTTSVLLVAALVLAGCGDDGPETQTVTDPPPPPDELGQYGEPCPTELVTEKPDQQPAEEVPDLIAPDEAWVCSYDLRGKTWKRNGEPVTLDQDQVDAVSSELDGLAPAAADRMCTADLGPRYVYVMSSGGDLTSVVVDDFGCHDVRLGDDLFESPPGEGEVPGVLQAPEALAEQLKQIAG